MNNSVCICIPKIEESVNKHLIKKIFEGYNIGSVTKINLVYSKEKKTKLAFVYLKYHQHKNSLLAKQYIDEGTDFKLVYNFPWFWKCYKAND